MAPSVSPKRFVSKNIQMSSLRSNNSTIRVQPTRKLLSPPLSTNYLQEKSHISSVSFVTTVTSTIPSSNPTLLLLTSEPSTDIYSGLLFKLLSGVTNSTTGYAEAFGSLNSATRNSIANHSVANVSVQWTGYLLTPDGSTGSWTFWALSDGTCEIWIGGNQIINSITKDSWSIIPNNSNVQYFPITNSTALHSSTYYPISIRYQSANPQKFFKLLFTSPSSKVSSDFHRYFYYCARPLTVSTIGPTYLPTEDPTIKTTRKPVTARPSMVPTVEPTMSSSSIRGLLFNVYLSNFYGIPNFFSLSVPYLAGFAVDFNSLSAAMNNQILLTGGFSIEWFGYISTQSVREGLWIFTVQSNLLGYLWIGKKALSGYNEKNADLEFGTAINFETQLFGSTYY